MQARDSIINFLFEFGISLNSLYPVFWMSSGSAESIRFGISGQWLFSQIKLNICLFILRKSRTSEAFQKCECKWNGNFGTNQIKANEIIQSRRLVKFRPILDFHPNIQPKDTLFSLIFQCLNWVSNNTRKLIKVWKYFNPHSCTYTNSTKQLR